MRAVRWTLSLAAMTVIALVGGWTADGCDRPLINTTMERQVGHGR